MKALHDFEISVDVIAKHMKISKTKIYKMIKDGFKYEDKEEREPILDEDDRTAIIEAVVISQLQRSLEMSNSMLKKSALAQLRETAQR